MHRWVWRIVPSRGAGEAGPRARGGSDAEEEGAVGEGLREAHETRAAGDREDARQGEGVPRDRLGARPRALDGRQRGGEAPVRDVAPRAARRAGAGGGGAGGGVPAPGVVAEVLRRVLEEEGPRVQPEAARLLQRGDGAARGRRRALRVQARHRRDRGRGRGQARRDTRRAAARAVARADRDDQARPRALRIHDIPLGGRRVRRDDQHGAEAQGGLQAEAQVGAGRGGAALRALVARGVRGASRGRARRRLGDGHRRGEEGRLGEAAHAPPRAHGLPAGDTRARRGVRLGARGAGARPRRARRGRHAPGLPARAHRQRRRVRRRGRDRCAARRASRRDAPVLLRPAPRRPEGRLREEPRGDQEAPAQGPRDLLRPARAPTRRS